MPGQLVWYWFVFCCTGVFFLSLFQLDSQFLCDSWPQGTWRTGKEAAYSLETCWTEFWCVLEKREARDDHVMAMKDQWESVSSLEKGQHPGRGPAPWWDGFMAFTLSPSPSPPASWLVGAHLSKDTWALLGFKHVMEMLIHTIIQTCTGRCLWWP